jgi:hypothetical protein
MSSLGNLLLGSKTSDAMASKKQPIRGTIRNAIKHRNSPKKPIGANSIKPKASDHMQGDGLGEDIFDFVAEPLYNSVFGKDKYKGFIKHYRNVRAPAADKAIDKMKREGQLKRGSGLMGGDYFNTQFYYDKIPKFDPKHYTQEEYSKILSSIKPKKGSKKKAKFDLMPSEKKNYKELFEQDLYKNLYKNYGIKTPSHMRELSQYHPIRLEEHVDDHGIITGFEPARDMLGRLQYQNAMPNNYVAGTRLANMQANAAFDNAAFFNNYQPSTRIGYAVQVPTTTKASSSISSNSRKTSTRAHTTANPSRRDPINYESDVYDVRSQYSHPSDFSEEEEVSIFDVAGRRGRDFRGQFGSIAPSTISELSEYSYEPESSRNSRSSRSGRSQLFHIDNESDGSSGKQSFIQEVGSIDHEFGSAAQPYVHHDGYDIFDYLAGSVSSSDSSHNS